MQTSNPSKDTISTTDNIKQSISATTQKYVHLLKIYKAHLFDGLPIDLLDENELYANLQQIFTTFLLQPEALTKSILQWQQKQALVQVNTNDFKLLAAVNNFLDDLIYHQGHLSYTLTNQQAFAIGVNIAITPGKVIYQNELMQLIQYTPVTNKIYEKPILFIPPWINKYYILDLSPENSLVKWLVAQGFTVFMISWVNPNAKLAEKDWQHYLLEGPIAALDIITKTTATPSVHLAGYCIGGTLLSCALAYLQHHNDNRVASGTFFNTLLDFSSPGPLTTFIDKKQLSILAHIVDKKGYLDGRILDLTFNMLRPYELILSSFVNNYLLEKPNHSDLLFWNADATNLPKKMFDFYMQHIYLDNSLIMPNKIILNNTPINIQQIKVPLFFVAAEKDHIVPWQSSYVNVHLHKCKVSFILADAGHIASIINSPIKDKYSFKTNNSVYPSSKQWLQTSSRHTGSWWPFWQQWLTILCNKQVAKKQRLIAKNLVIENAPGTYVLKRI